MMKKHIKAISRMLSLLLVLSLVLVPFCAIDVSAAAKAKTPIRQSTADTTYNGWIAIDDKDVVASVGTEAMQMVSGEANIQDGGYYLNPNDKLVATLPIVEAGKFGIVLEYKMVEGRLSDSTVEVAVEEKSVLTSVYGLWQDETKNYNHDRYGNEVTSNQVLLKEITKDYVRDSRSLDMNPSIFEFKAGNATITITNQDEDIILNKVSVVRINDIPSYKEYCAEIGKKPDDKSDLIIIEGEDYAVKSDSYIRSQSKQNAAVYPYSPYEKYLSTIDCGSYDSAGQRVMWNFAVEKDGWYQVALHYSQPEKEGMSTYRDIEIDGKVPFKEMLEVPFAYTGNGFKNLTVTDEDGKPVKVYLTKGKHTIGLYTQACAMQPFLDDITEIIAEISDIGLSLQQIAGSSADSTRTWDIETYIPGVIDQLTAIQNRLLDLYDEMASVSGSTPASCMNLKTASGIIKQILKKPKKLPAKVSQLSIGTGSATELLASLQIDIRLQGIALDRLFVYGENETLPRESANFFVSTFSGIKRFVYSLFNTDGAYAATSADEGVLNVWVNRSITYVETLQLITDSYFTPKSGIEVQFSVMPDANKLILANASNTCPDVALGVAFDTPYQLGLRGAAHELSSYPGFAEICEEYYNIADLDPYIYNGKFYGMPETMQFYALMYRKDILDKLDIDVPQTWTDIANTMPILRRSGMTFYMPLSSYTGTKGLDGLLPFFFQYNAELYSDDAMSVKFNSTNGIKAFEALTDLYSLYSVQNNMPSFYNNFRYGVSPIGIGNFSNYMQVYYAAPEIADAWTITLAPGALDENGNINRQQMSVDRGLLVMESSKLKDEAWEFIKWWMSDETQNEFGHTMLVKFGSGFIWNSANKDAFSRMSLPADDRDLIVEQWKHSQNYRNLPITYMLQRELSDAWYAVVNEGTPARIALNEAAVTVNNELKVKLKEFDYIDEDGNVLKPYDMRSVEEILASLKNKEGGEE